MTAELRRSLVLAGIGLLAGFALVVTLFGTGELLKRGFGPSETTDASGPVAALPQRPDAAAPREEGASTGPGKPGPAETMPASPTPSQAGRETDNQRQVAKPGADPTQGASASGDLQAPTFDIVRIEPNGDSVIAGRGAPNTTVELLRDDQPIARVLIDPSGQFAIVPPALPAGSSEITLRATGADGQTRLSKESVAVVVAAARDAKPLIAMTAPGKPTVVLSQPESVATPALAAGPTAEPVTDPMRDAKSAAKTTSNTTSNPTSRNAAKAPDARTGQAEPGAKPGAAVPPLPGAPSSAAPVKIVSVDAEEGGRLYVTGQAPPGATVRLYLNDTLVAPASVGSDGRVAFTIGRGVAPGDYRIRVDQVDPISGKVKTRSEVAFAMPVVPARSTARDQAAEARLPEVRAPAVAALLPPAASGPSTVSVQDRTPYAVPQAAAPAPLAERPVGTMAAPSPNPVIVRPSTDATPMKATSPKPEPEPGKPEPGKSGPLKTVVATPSPPKIAEAAANPTLPPIDGPRTVFVPEISTAKITRGDNLWQISRRIYGKGTRYTVIFDANQPQIRNPDLIYPGQIFVLPPEGTAAARAEDKRG